VTRASRYAKATNWVKDTRVMFFGGPKKPVIEGEIDHGAKGTRRVWVVLTDELLAEIARIAVYLSVEPDRERRGHSFWHSENPEREYPCDECSDAVKAAKEKWAKRVDTAPRLTSTAPAPPAPADSPREEKK
jgi:hypothetical protein